MSEEIILKSLEELIDFVDRMSEGQIVKLKVEEYE